MTNPHTRRLCRWKRLIFGLDWMWWCAWWSFFERGHVDCECPWSQCLPNVFGAIQTMAAFFVWTNMIHSIVSIMFTNNWQNDPNSSHVTVGIFHDNVWWWWWCAKCFTNLPNDSYNLCNNWQYDPNSSPQWQLASSLVHSRGVAARTERAAPAYYSLAFLDPDWDPGSWILDSGFWNLDSGYWV